MTYIPNLLPPAEPVGTPLRIALLGPPTLMWGGQPFPIARRQARALLYRIAAAAQPVPREQLGFLLWPESTESTARRNISSARRHFERALAFAQKHALPAAIAAGQFNLGMVYLIQGELTKAESMFWISYAPWEQQQHPRYTGVALVTLGYIAVLRGEAQQASALLDGFRQLIAAQETIYLLYALPACAGFATLQQRPLDAAALFGAGTRHAEHMRLALVRGALALAHMQVERARAQCAPDAFERALQHGRLLTLGEAVALAQSLLEAVNGQLEQFPSDRLATTA